jgi:outer membrane lipoprotein SlyB
MRGDYLRLLLLPLLLAAGLTACASNAVQPGIVYTSGVPSGSGPGPGPGPGPYPYSAYATPPANTPYPNGPNGPVSSSYTPLGGAQPVAAAPPAQGSNPNPGGPVAGDSGRVVSIRDVSLAGSGGGGGMSNGPLIGGLLGAGAGATIGAITSQSLGGGIVGAVLGLVGGAIAGTVASGNYGTGTYGGRGIEVTVQRDDGQQVTVAQRDDGDIQLGDRVQIVQNRQGVAQVVRDTARRPD